MEVNFKLKYVYMLKVRQFEQGLTLYTFHLHKYVVIYNYFENIDS